MLKLNNRNGTTEFGTPIQTFIYFSSNFEYFFSYFSRYIFQSIFSYKKCIVENNYKKRGTSADFSSQIRAKKCLLDQSNTRPFPFSSSSENFFLSVRHPCTSKYVSNNSETQKPSRNADTPYASAKAELKEIICIYFHKKT